MTRKEYEDGLLDALEAFERVWKKLNPEGTHIAAFILDGRMHIIDYDAPDYPMCVRDENGTRHYSGLYSEQGERT